MKPPGKKLVKQSLTPPHPHNSCFTKKKKEEKKKSFLCILMFYKLALLLFATAVYLIQVQYFIRITKMVMPKYFIREKR